MKKHLLRITGISRFVAVALALPVVLGLSLAGLRSVASAPDRYTCLSFDYIQRRGYGSRTNHMLVELASGSILTSYRPINPNGGSPAPIAWNRGTSPDRKYVTYQMADQNSTQSSLFIADANGGSPRVLQDKINYLVTASWSPDSSRLALLWTTTDYFNLAVVKPDGSGYQMIFQGTMSPTLAGWSPDGQYLAVAVHNFQNSFVEYWSVRDGRLTTLVPHGQLSFQVSTVQWSPTGRQFTYLVRDSNQVVYVYLVYPSTGTETSMIVGQGGTFFDPEWSPDGNYFGVAAQNTQGTTRLLVVYRDNAGVIMGQTEFPVAPNYSDDYTWLPDSHSILAYLEEPASKTGYQPNPFYDLLRYDVEDGSSSLIARRLVSIPLRSDAAWTSLALSSMPKGKHQLDVMNTSQMIVTPVITGADDMGDPFWSSDGQLVGAVWATGYGTGRVVHLTWASRDGSNRHDVSSGYWDIKNLTWVTGHTFAFFAQHQDGYAVEEVNLDSGEVRRLAGGQDQINLFDQVGSKGELQLWWFTKGTVGTAAYDLTGNQLFIYRGEAQAAASKIYFGRLFTAPGGKIGALKMRLKGIDKVPDFETIQLAAPDGSWTRMIRTGLSGLGDPLWSPDGTQVAFTQSIQRGPITLEVVTAQGQEVRHLGYPGQSYPALAWTRCH